MAAHYPIVEGVQFKDVEGYPGYCVGDDGSVWSRRPVGRSPLMSDAWRRLSAGITKAGYPLVSLNVGGKSRSFNVHTLVLTTFVGPAPVGMECCHGNGDPADNRLCNLRWDTRKANCADAETHGRRVKGETSGTSKLTNASVSEIRELREADPTMTYDRLASRFGVRPETIYDLIKRRTWKHVP
jgi:hypothetical protein